MRFIKTRFVGATLLLAVAAAPVLGVAAKERKPIAAAAAGVLTIAIDNFGRVSATYYRGAQPRERDFVELAALGVKTVIDLQEDGLASEPGLVERAGMKYVRIPMTTHKPPTGDQLVQFLALVNDPVSQPVYVHCAGGRHRTGVMTAVYRMTSDGWTSDQAFNEMKHYDFGADLLHPEFKRFIAGFRPSGVIRSAIVRP